MKFYFAPMEGLTGYIYRNAHYTFFNNIDKYFSPFILANQSESFKTKELKDILPENNLGINLVPQLLTNNSKDFIYTSKKLKSIGYNEVNLNLGCPSGTVVSKYRGAGFLSKVHDLDEFLYDVFSNASTKISIKTRTGITNHDEFFKIMEVYNKYPIDELIIHPRLQKDFYKNKPNLEIFTKALETSKNKISYNGDIFYTKDYFEFSKAYKGIDSIMIGRGLLSNPALIMEIRGNGKLDKIILKEFHDKILEDYKEVLFGDRNILFKMKELWFYMIQSFSNHEKYSKRIRKSERLNDYSQAVSDLFREQELL